MNSKFRFIFFALLCFGFIQFNLTSCTKTNTVTKTVIDTVTVVHTDTLSDTVITAQILTANSWKLQEDRGVIGNIPLYYLRGGSSNTQSFDNEYITFNSDNTGTYTDNSGTQSSFTWTLTSGTNPTIVWLGNLPSPVTITWEHVFYKNAALHYDEYYSLNGTNTQTSDIRIPK